MRTIVTNLYKFEELSTEAQQVAINHYRDHVVIPGEINWSHEMLQSFLAVYETAGIKLHGYSLGIGAHSYVSFSMDPDVSELSGARAFAWIESNLLSRIRVTRSEYLNNRKDYLRYGYRIGKIKACPFTGCYFDHNFLDTIDAAIRRGDTIGEVFQYRLVETYVSLLETEYEFQQSEQYIRETLIDNGCEFTVDGMIY